MENNRHDCLAMASHSGWRHALRYVMVDYRMSYHIVTTRHTGVYAAPREGARRREYTVMLPVYATPAEYDEDVTCRCVISHAALSMLSLTHATVSRATAHGSSRFYMSSLPLPPAGISLRQWYRRLATHCVVVGRHCHYVVTRVLLWQ